MDGVNWMNWVNRGMVHGYSVNRVGQDGGVGYRVGQHSWAGDHRVWDGLGNGVGGHGSRVGHPLVLDVGDVPAVAGVVGVVVDDLGAAVRKGHPVGASHGASVRVLVL